MYKRLSEREKQEIKTLYVKGLLSGALIAERLGISRQTVGTVLKKLEVDTSKRNARKVIECDHCGALTEKTRSQYRKFEKHFCSLDCYSGFLRSEEALEDKRKLDEARKKAENLMPYGGFDEVGLFMTKAGDVLVFPSRDEMILWKRTGLTFDPYSIKHGKKIKCEYSEES